MKPLKLKIQEQANLLKVPQPVIEKDYALSYLLAGIGAHPILSKTLVFKGGTALKKIYFGDYRFSEDLDFSVINAPIGEALEKALSEVAESSKQLLNAYGHFEIQLKRNPEKKAHPRGQEAFNFYVKFPWQPSNLCRVKVEITHDEPVVLPPDKMPILHGYGEELLVEILSYSLEEIVAEKLRSLFQTHQKLVQRGWNRPRARDYYDLWHLFRKYHDSLNVKKVLATLHEKCIHRQVSYQSSQDFFTAELVQEARIHWKDSLRVLVKDLPECDQVLEETRKFIESLCNSPGTADLIF